MARHPGRDPLRRWLGAALGLHIAWLALVAALSARPEEHREPPPLALGDAPRLVWLDPGELLPTPAATDEPPRAPTAAEPSETASPGRASVDGSALAAVSRHRRALAPTAPARGDFMAGSPEGPGAADEGDSEGDDDGPDGSDTPTDGPRLSLSELGVGPSNNPFTRERPAGFSQRQVLNRRLRQSLAVDVARQDQALGLGPEGPAVAAIGQIVMQSPTPPNTSGLLVIHTDAAGLTRSVEVLESSNDAEGWKRIAKALEQALSGKKVRVPQGSGGVSMQVRVTSRVALPSGADPGFAVELFGQTIKAGSGDKSARLKLLSPEITVSEVQVPDSNGQTMPMVGFSPNIIGLSGDLVDIGAVARRIVHAHLVQLDVLPPDVVASDPHSIVDSPARAP